MKDLIISICKIINEAFSEPFLPDGFVDAQDASDIYDKPAISLHIGARDVTFALDGEWIGQSTNLTSEWYSVAEDTIKIIRMRANPLLTINVGGSAELVFVPTLGTKIGEVR